MSSRNMACVHHRKANSVSKLVVARPAIEDTRDVMTLSRQRGTSVELQNKYSEKYLRFKDGVVDTAFKNNGPEDQQLVFRATAYHAGSYRTLWTISFGENLLLRSTETGSLEMAEATGTEDAPADENLFEVHNSTCTETIALQELKGKRRFITEVEGQLKMVSKNAQGDPGYCSIKDSTEFSDTALFRYFETS